MSAQQSEILQCDPRRLIEVAADLESALTQCAAARPMFSAEIIRRETLHITMRDGIRLATDVYFPPTLPAPAILVRTPYNRRDARLAECLIYFARHGYVVVSQDCRGTGDSEPETWDYYVYEREDSFDLVHWITHQTWSNGFIGACGGSYLAQTQWCMAMHPKMSTIVPEVGGLGIAYNTAHLYMFLNAYSRSVGKGAQKVAVSYQDMERQMVEETLKGGYFNEPLHQPFSQALLARYPLLRTLAPSQGQRFLWERYTRMDAAQRAELIKQALSVDQVTSVGVESLSSVFGHRVAHDAHMFPSAAPSKLCRSLQAPALMVTGWYDWGLNDALATWDLLQREAKEPARTRNRLLITPSAHAAPGYHEDKESHPELDRTYRTPGIVELLRRWYATVGNDGTDSWPAVIYYLMGANEWYAASAWPPPQIKIVPLYLDQGGVLSKHLPLDGVTPDSYIYDPRDPTPTVGGSIVSYVYVPGSADVSEVQRRPDVLTFTTSPLKDSLDVVGPLRVVLYVSSSAVDTDFCARVSDVFPNGRAIQLQSGLLRARYRNADGDPEWMEPGEIYRIEIDLWATANRFHAGHRLRLDISSADFPRFDRNTNLGGVSGEPLSAQQTIYHDARHPSHLLLPVLDGTPDPSQ